MSDESTPLVALFRPDDERSERGLAVLAELGVEALADPMLAVEPTGRQPRTDADYTVLTSKTGAELLDPGYEPGGVLCAIGPSTAGALRQRDLSVDVVPDTYSSAGLVERLEAEVAGERVEVARSNHGSPALLEGLEAAGAYLHETVLYRLERPAGSGRSVERAAAGELDGALFSSSLTVEHFLEAAAERGLEREAREGLDRAVVGAIGEPTADRAREAGIGVDVVPAEAAFESLAEAVVDRLE